VDIGFIFYPQKGMCNMNKSLKFWSNWLLLASDGMILFGLLMVFAPDFFRNSIYRLYTDFYYARGGAFEALPSADVTLQVWIYALAGAISIGWMVALAMIIFIPFRRGEKWAWWAVTGSLATWFVLDCLGSAIYGMSINLIINVGAFILFTIPLAMTYRIFFGVQQEKSALMPSGKSA